MDRWENEIVRGSQTDDLVIKEEGGPLASNPLSHAKLGVAMHDW